MPDAPLPDDLPRVGPLPSGADSGLTDGGITGLTSEAVEAGGRQSDPLAQTAETDLALGDVKTRAVRATAGLLARQVVMRGLDVVGMIVLARVLEPAVFGVFAIVRFVVFFFERFASVGLSATLLRKPTAVTEGELRTVFTVQHAIVAVSVALLWVGAPWVVGRHPELREHAHPEPRFIPRRLGTGGTPALSGAASSVHPQASGDRTS